MYRNGRINGIRPIKTSVMKLFKYLFKFIIIATVTGASLFGNIYATTTVVYDSSDTIFPNPERGFTAFRSAPLDGSFIHSIRQQGVTLVWRIYCIPQFVNDALSISFLNTVAEDLRIARTGGVKLVLRFSYTDLINGPDAPLEIILKHIEQLGPILHDNYDVIAYMDAGFIGAWGEWYYSSNHLNNTDDRRAVLFQLLDVLPPDRMVLVRTPGYKRDIYNRYEPLSPEEAFTQTKRARTGADNDCFLADAWDAGTYGDIEADKTFLNLDNRYVPQAGETCSPSAYSECSNALKDLKRMHWSALHKDYNRTVLQEWIDGGCMDEVERNLGYRFRLLSSVIQDSVRPAGAFNLSFSIVNEGWASPYNPRNLEVILRGLDNATYFLLVDEDPRMWMSGDTVDVLVNAGIPDYMPLGNYEVLLNFPDPIPTLYNRPEYSIRLANEHVWEESTGHNSLLHTMTVDSNAACSNYEGQYYFQMGTNSGLSINNKVATTPQVFQLKKNFPNPFNSATTIEFGIYRRSSVKVEIYDCNGKLIDLLLDKKLGHGNYQVPWEPAKISSGVYIYTVSVNGISRSGRCTYLK